MNNVVGAALRGRPFPDEYAMDGGEATGGHGGPPLQNFL